MIAPDETTYAYMEGRPGVPEDFDAAVERWRQLPTDDGAACAIEYNAVRWGRTEIPPQAGVAVYVRGRSGLLSAARIYDDVDPPLRGEPVGSPKIRKGAAP